jgi:hypothetical protein
MALEGAIGRWSGFAKVLRRSDREAFDELMDMSRSFASAGSNATNPILFEPFVLSIMLGQQKRILDLEKKLNINGQPSIIREPEQGQENSTRL